MDSLSIHLLPPGFGFHPSDKEIIHYLKRKVLGQNVDSNLIPVVEVFKHEPWDLPALCPIPTRDGKWHFFAIPEKKYSKSFRFNRATGTGYWKSTGKDRDVKFYDQVIGTKKTLVFHEGRPPNGNRTEWIMHEYYINESECKAAPHLKDAFVLCRVTKRDGWPSQTTEPATNGDGWASQATEPEPHGPGVSGQIEEGDNYVENSENIAVPGRSEELLNLSDIDDWIESLRVPDSAVEFRNESNNETEDIWSPTPKPVPAPYLGETDDDFLSKEDVDKILQLDYENFVHYQGLNIEELDAEIIPPSTSPTLGSSLLRSLCVVSRTETSGSSVLSDGGLTSSGPNEHGGTGIAIRRSRSSFLAPRARPHACPTPPRRIRYGSCKLQMSGSLAQYLSLSGNVKPDKLTTNFPNNKTSPAPDKGEEKDIDSNLVDRTSDSYSCSADSEADSVSQDDNSSAVSLASQESVSTTSYTSTHRLNNVDGAADRQGDTRNRACGKLRFFKPARPTYLFFSAFAVALAAASAYFLAQRAFLS